MLAISAFAQFPTYTNNWTEAPKRIPSNVSVDAPLMGNGDVTMSLGYKNGSFRYYLGKNDFWRLRSKADGLSGPRVLGFLDIKIEGFEDAVFSAEQSIGNGVTLSSLTKGNERVELKSWVSAVENLVFVEVKAIQKKVKISFNLGAPEHLQAKFKAGKTGEAYWITRAFLDSVDIQTEAAVALKPINYKGNAITIEPGKTLILAAAIESKFKKASPLEFVLNHIRKVNSITSIAKKSQDWWQHYWDKSSLAIADPVLMKAYYQGLYTMAACSRDPKFPPGIFGWTTTDSPAWNGDYHLNYNFQAPFYALVTANRLEQAAPHDAPLIDFMPRGKWYAKNVSQTRGVLYPVGIGPLGIEVTKDFKEYKHTPNFENGGLFFGQRSNAAYGLVNMAQYWRGTYDLAYGKKIYPYVLAVVDFWEDFLKMENGRYVIYNDAVHEGSGKDKNSILSLGLLRNALGLILDLSSTLKIDESKQDKWKDILNRLSVFPVQIRKEKKVFRYTEEGVDWWADNGLGIQHIYPGNAITLDSPEAVLTIARNTIGEMQRWQDSNTSNSFFTAAIRVGYDPSVVMDELHKYALKTYPNGFQLNNPHGIENSCTVANAVSEMLCMSVGNVIRLFNIPENQDASFRNIRAWGAFLVSASLEKNQVTVVKIRSEQGKACTIINPWPGKEIRLIRNGKKAETIQGKRLSFDTGKNEVVELQPL